MHHICVHKIICVNITKLDLFAFAQYLPCINVMDFPKIVIAKGLLKYKPAKDTVL